MIFHSAFENSYLWYPLIGFVVGLIGTFIGGGGGFFFIPVLTLLFGQQTNVALATSIAATLPICIIGTIGHYRNGNVKVGTGLIFAAAGVLGAFSGASITSLITARQLKVSWGIYTILIAFQIIITTWKKKRDEAKGVVKPENTRIKKIATGSFYGFLAGIITATFGTSGATPTQAGMFAMRMPVKAVIGTSLMVVMVNNASALGAHFIIGQIDLTQVYFLTAGTIAGALLGPKLLRGVRIEGAEGPIRQLYALGMIVFGILMIFLNGGNKG